jgi:hypothetical protein
MEKGRAGKVIAAIPKRTSMKQMREAGFVDAASRPLMDPALWLEALAFPGYLITARRP